MEQVEVAQTQQEQPPQPELGPGGVPVGATTDQYYRTQNIPNRFNNPEWFQGYSTKKEHPMYRTSASEYGSRIPTVHTMPITFNARSQKFSEALKLEAFMHSFTMKQSVIQHLGKCGMYRNQSLNTAMDQSRV